jgi:hypothetical protein
MNKGYPPLPDTQIVIKMKIFPKTCALVAVSIALPVLAYTSSKGGHNKGDTPERHEGNKDKDKDKDKDEKKDETNKGLEDNQGRAEDQDNPGRVENKGREKVQGNPGREDNKAPGPHEDKKGNEGKGEAPGQREDKGKGDKHESDKGGKHGGGRVSVVPETNAAWVLLPFFGAVLLLSWRQFSRTKT